MAPVVSVLYIPYAWLLIKKKTKPTKNHGSKIQKKAFHFLSKFPSHSAEELDHAYIQVPGPYHLYWPK